MASATYLVRNGQLVEVDVIDGKVVEVNYTRCPECGQRVENFFLEHHVLQRSEQG